MGQPEPLRILREEVGFEIFRLDSQRHLIELSPGVYSWSWLDKAITYIRDTQSGRLPPARALLSIYSVPAWLDPTAQPIGNTTAPYYLPFDRPEWVEGNIRFVDAISSRYPDQMFGVQHEFNLRRLWLNPETGNAASPESFVELAIKPIAQVLHAKGLKLIAPGLSMQPEDRSKNGTWEHAKDCFFAARHLGNGLIDSMDAHFYNDKHPKSIPTDIKDFMREAYFAHGVGKKSLWWTRPFYISETGINEDDTRSFWEKLWDSINRKPFDPEEHQRQKWLPLLDFFEHDPAAENIAAAFVYAGFGGKAALLEETSAGNWRLKPIAREIQRRLAA